MYSNYNDNELGNPLFDLIKYNFYTHLSIEENNKYHAGTNLISAFETYENAIEENNFEYKFKYIKNLVLREPELVRTELNDELDPFFQILLHCSYNNFELAQEIFKNLLGIDNFFEITGAKARSKSGFEKLISVVSFKFIDRECFPYIDDEFNSVDHSSIKLTLSEMHFLYIFTLKTIHENEGVYSDLFKSQIEALCKMAFFQNYPQYNLAFEYLYLSHTGKYHDIENSLETYLSNFNYNDSTLFSFPLIPLFSIIYEIANYKLTTYNYEEAYSLFKNYPFRTERISCLVKMKDFEKALAEISESISILGESPSGFREKIKLSNLYVTAGDIKQDPSLYDKAYAVCKHYLPLKSKAKFFYERGLYEEAVDTLKKAVEVFPCATEAKFYLGCSLLELERYSEALSVFKELHSSDKKNPRYIKKLSLCQYMVDDIDNTLLYLKKIACEDPESMKILIKLSVQNRKIDFIVWALKHCIITQDVVSVIKYLISNNIITPEVLKDCLECNRKIDSFIVNDILQKIF